MMKFIDPYKAFIGSVMPEWLELRTEVSPSAKMAYARLCRYYGKDGKCFPSVETLATAIGKKKRQMHNILNELERFKLIFREEKKNKNGTTSTMSYKFLEHPWMTESQTKSHNNGGATNCTAQAINCNQDVQDIAYIRESDSKRIKRSESVRALKTLDDASQTSVSEPSKQKSKAPTKSQKQVGNEKTNKHTSTHRDDKIPFDPIDQQIADRLLTKAGLDPKIFKDFDPVSVYAASISGQDWNTAESWMLKMLKGGVKPDLMKQAQERFKIEREKAANKAIKPIAPESTQTHTGDTQHAITAEPAQEHAQKQIEQHSAEPDNTIPIHQPAPTLTDIEERHLRQTYGANWQNHIPQRSPQVATG